MIDQIDILSDDESAYPSSYANNNSDEDMPPIFLQHATKMTKAKPESKTTLLKREREIKAQERKRKQAMKPENSLKLIKAIVSADILQNDYAGDLILALNKAEIAYRVDVNPVASGIVCWERQDPFDEKSVEREDHVVVLMRAEEFVNLVSTCQMKEKVKEMQSAMNGSTFTLVVYELENYFRFQKTKKNREFQNEVRGQNNKNQAKKGAYSNAAVLTREQVECALSELQILYNWGHCIFNQPSSVSSYICQYTKAVADAPRKLEEQSKEQEQLEWFSLGDSRSTVRVDKQGNGLARLWRQQLCQFNLAGLDSSEAIAHAYPSPKALAEAYNGLMPDDAQLLLQNIQVRLPGAGIVDTCAFW